jgi:glycosyltransferase involved in cell wall biosynthesis
VEYELGENLTTNPYLVTWDSRAQTMKIVQISTYDTSGGAAIAAYRLNRGLHQIGQDCGMLVRHKDSSDNSVHSVTATKNDENSDEKFFLEVAIQEHYIDSHRTDISNTIFSLPYPGYDLSTLPLVRSSDLLNLHWVAQYQSPLTLHKLFSLHKPIVWTLHDQWAFTGGCHYAAGCKKYERDCAGCPQLDHDGLNLTAAVLEDKAEVLKGGNLTIVTPSRWMASCSRESRLLKGFRTEVIPNSLETDVFRPALSRWILPFFSSCE